MKSDAASPSPIQRLKTVGLQLTPRFWSNAEHGFETSLARALAMVGGEVLFQLPAPFLPDCQRVAAVSTGADGARRTYLVLLSEDGRSTRVEDVAGSGNPLASLARSYVAVLAQMAA